MIENFLGFLTIPLFLWSVGYLVVTYIPRLGQMNHSEEETIDYCTQCGCFHNINRDCNLFEKIHKKLQ